MPVYSLALTLTSSSCPGPYILVLCFIVLRSHAVNLPILRMHVKKFCSLGTAVVVPSASVLFHGAKVRGDFYVIPVFVCLWHRTNSIGTG